MADPQQLSMADILSGEEPAKVEAPPAPAAAPAAKEPLDIPVLGDKPLPEESKVERPRSRKQAHRDKEQEAQGRVRDPETGQYVSKVAAEAPPAVTAKPEPEPAKPAVVAPQQEFTDKEKAFLRTAQDERGKRQAVERELAEVRAKLPKEEPKTFWDDPEAALQRQKEELRQENLNTRLKTAELIARQRHPDFDEKIAVFGQVMEQTPGLHVQWLSALDPAEFAYQLGKNHQELKEAGDLPALRAKIEKEAEIKVRARIEAELKAKAEALAKDRAALPPSLSEAKSTGTNKQVWGGPPSMDSILHDKG